MMSSHFSPLFGELKDRKLGSLERAGIVQGETSAKEMVAYHECTKHHIHRYATGLCSGLIILESRHELFADS